MGDELPGINRDFLSALEVQGKDTFWFKLQQCSYFFPDIAMAKSAKLIQQQLEKEL